jgi:hypothetical protein
MPAPKCTLVPFVCKQCGKGFEILPSNAKRGHGKFCSKPCRALWETIPVATLFSRRIGPMNERGCLLWAGAINRGGYGTIGKRPAPLYAHRVSWELSHGPIPAGMCVLHRCDNRRCVEPSHLFLGTIADNNADKVAKGRQAKPGRRPGSKRFLQEQRQAHKTNPA